MKMVDKKYCMSSYMAFRYIEDDNKDFYDWGGEHHQNIKSASDAERILIKNAEDIDREIDKQMKQHIDKKKGILLSGGMDFCHYSILS